MLLDWQLVHCGTLVSCFIIAPCLCLHSCFPSEKVGLITFRNFPTLGLRSIQLAQVETTQRVWYSTVNFTCVSVPRIGTLFGIAAIIKYWLIERVKRCQFLARWHEY